MMFVGDDWKGTDKWDQIEKDFSEFGVEIFYFPYTSHTSSSILREVLSKI
jgi:glycerol-3-phosphate cytidylyltransferase